MSTRGKDSIDKERRKPRVADKAARDRARSLSAKLVAARGANQSAGVVGHRGDAPGSGVQRGSASGRDTNGGRSGNGGSRGGDGGSADRSSGRDTASAAGSVPAVRADARDIGGAETGEENRIPQVSPGLETQAPPKAPKKPPRLAVTPPQDNMRLDEKMIAGGYRTLFSLPALAGYGKHWELDDFETKTLTEPTARMAANLSPATSRFLAKVLDPITVLGALGMLLATRLELTKVYLRELKIQREIEVKRAALSRVVEETGRGDAGQVISPHTNGEVATPGASSAVGGKTGTKDLFA